MKRHGNLFEQIVDLDNIYLAYRKARKGKGWQDTVKSFERNLDENILSIRDSLINKTFTTSPYKTKTIYEPKQRVVYKLPFNPDRIVQHALMNVIEPIWDRMFIFDSYACRQGKGIHAGSKRTMEFVRRNRYCLKCDVSKFYPSVDHDILCDDFLLFHDDKKYLGEMAKVIEDFLWERLELKLSKCDLLPVSRGVDFLGYRHFRGYILVRKSTAKRVKKRLKRLPVLLEKGIITKEQYRSSLASTMGWLKWANSYNLRVSLGIDNLMEAACNE